jgi:hypothetical protein
MARRKKSELEAGLNGRIQRALSGRDPVRVENAVGPGTPDIYFIAGWIESKRLPAWPKKADSVVKVPKYVPEQRAWHVRHRHQGGVVYLAIEVESTTFVFDASRGRPIPGNDDALTNARQGAVRRVHHGMEKAFRKFIDSDKLPGIA